MGRRDEVWRLNQLAADELASNAGDHLVVVADLDALHLHMAKHIAKTIQQKPNAVLILPYGPTGQYPLLRDIINSKRISLKETKLFFMDEYADEGGSVLPTFHPLSFKGGIAWLWEQIEQELRPPEENIIFPDQYNFEELSGMIKKAGGVDICYGGVGIHGHIAFNEPEPSVHESTCRLVTLNDYTVTLNSIRSQVGGDLENFPRKAYTLGMKECLSARKIRLYCRCDIPGLDWARTVLRLAVLGQQGDDYPVTWIRNHANWQVITDKNTADPPKNVL